MRLFAEAVSIVRIWLNQIAATAVPPVVFWCTALVMSRSVTLRRDIEKICSNIERVPAHRDREPLRALKRHRIVTCTIWALSGSHALAEAYLLSKGVTDMGTTADEYSPERCVLLFSAWLLSEHQAVLTAIMDLENSCRVDADCFLVRSLTAMIVHIQSQKGVLVSTSESVYHYLRFWSLRPVATVLQPLLTRLTYHRNTRRKFGQLLRQEWMLDYGNFKLAPDISNDETHMRVFRSGSCGLAWIQDSPCDMMPGTPECCRERTRWYVKGIVIMRDLCNAGIDLPPVGPVCHRGCSHRPSICSFEHGRNVVEFG